jgi:hypothetical protein
VKRDALQSLFAGKVDGLYSGVQAVAGAQRRAG